MNSILPTVVNNVLFAALLALFAWIISRFWKNQHVVHLLWVIMLAKLITPPRWNVPIPVLGLLSILMAPAGQAAKPAIIGENHQATATRLSEENQNGNAPSIPAGAMAPGTAIF